MYGSQKTFVFFLFVVVMISIVLAGPVPNNPIRQSPRLAWAQFAGYPAYQGPMKRWSPLEPSIRYYKRAPASFDTENYLADV